MFKSEVWLMAQGLHSTSLTTIRPLPWLDGFHDNHLSQVGVCSSGFARLQGSSTTRRRV